ncbi:MAG TPA: Ig domain-containing protein [Terriglobales bacterium]|nr:Ig domain-containing protein [Terriglobales bacterium]
MRNPSPGRHGARVLTLLALFLVAAGCRTRAQQAPPLTVLTQAPPRAVAQFPYDLRLRAEGGTPPLHWKLAGGTLPPGIELDAEHGTLRGTPTSPGDFPLTLSVTDSETPPATQSRAFLLKVVVPLELVWEKMPAVEGDRVLGSVEISNNAPVEIDLTLIVLAVNEYGKAFALGYQHGPMPAQTQLQSFAFGSQMNLPRGRYVVHVDVVAEVAARQAIYRARLQTSGALQVP